MATSRICSIPDCGKAHVGRGWCSVHYHRWERHGDPLGGGTSTGEARAYFTDIVMPYEGDECLPWPFAKDSDGYGWIGPRRVHRLVCERVNGPPPTPKHEAAHECGQGHNGCCTKRHLSWKTHAENMADKIIHGTGGAYRRVA